MRTLAFALLVGANLAGQGGKQPITAADLLKIRQVTGVSLSADGSTAVYLVRSIHTQQPADGKGDPTYAYRSNIWRVDLQNADSRPIQLTFGDKSDSQIALSPDGKRLAFVRMDTSNKERPRSQVWVMPMTVGGEAEAVTSLENAAGDPKWRPDSKALLVTSAIPISKINGKPQFAMDRPAREWFDYQRPSPNAKPDDPRPAAQPDGDRVAVRQWLEQNASKNNPTVITRLSFQDEQSLRREMTIPQVWLVDLENGNKATQLTNGFYPHSNCNWSADGSKLACVSWPATNEHPDIARRTNIVTMNAKGEDRRVVLDRPAHVFSNPQWIPGGSELLVTVGRFDEPGRQRLARLDVAKEDFTLIADPSDETFQGAQPASDGSILVTNAWQGGVPLRRFTAQGEQVVVAGRTAGVQVFEEAAGVVVFSRITAANPNELFVQGKDGRARQLTELNSNWLASKELATPEEKWLTRPDGTKVQYWIMNPTRVEAGKKYPWVLDMHGGPAAMWGPGEFTMWHEFQVFCAWGYGVVYANPRGSAGYGYKFQRANYKNWGEGPSGDVLAALDATIRENPLVDKERLFLTGGSYAGYLTAWIVGHDHRFKAAAAQRGVYDLTTFYGEGNAFRLVEGSFGGFPWEPETQKILDRESPYTYVSKIRTPLLILHGSLDLRTGVSQSEMLYRSLKQLGRPVEYIRYPNIGHELTRSGPPVQRMDHLLRMVEFFERYSNNTREAPVEKPLTVSGASGSLQ